MNTTDFFNRLFNNCSEGYITIWTLPDKRTYWFRSSDYALASEYAVKLGQTENTFFGLGIRKEKLNDGKRGSKDDISSVVALYADIDVLGPAHAETKLPNTKDEALSFLNSLPVKPSIIVWSGNGIHSYWILDKPYNISNKADGDYISSISDSWGQFINKEASKYGWKLDTVSDLARVLRVAGTINHKLGNEAKCEVIYDTDITYPLNSFEEYKTSAYNGAIERESVDGIVTGSATRVLAKCSFMQYCKNNAHRLPEPYWHAMITNLSLAKDGAEMVREISKPYPKYSSAETNEKISRAVKENKPHTCIYIKQRLGFNGCGDCNIKAPVVYSILSMSERVQQLLEGELTEVDAVFDDETLTLMAYAKNKMPAEYAKYKLKIRSKVSLRDFDNAVKHKLNSSKEYLTVEDTEMSLCLKGINLNGAVQPARWDISVEKGVRKIMTTKEGTQIITACPSALVISKRFENVDNESEKVEIAFYRNNKWKHVTAPRSALFNKSMVIRYGDSGLPVSSSTATELVNYLTDYENSNIDKIPLMKSVSRLGWVSSTQFFPYNTAKDVCFETEFKEADDIYKNLKEHGNFDVWKDMASKARQNMFARFLIASSFASPLLEKLNHRVFFVHVWHDSKSGKTAAIKAGVSVWGNPKKLMGSFNATPVGLERMADMLRHIVFAIDELQVLNEKRMALELIIYGLANGFGRLRGSKDGGVQDLTTWRNIALTSGEQPISRDDSNDGVYTRVLELHGKPVEDVDFAHELHVLSEHNYGFAGGIYVKFLAGMMSGNNDIIKKDFERMYSALKDRFGISNHLDNTTVVCLGDYYAEQAIWHSDKDFAFEMAVNMGVAMLSNNKSLEKEDIVARAWCYIKDWCVANEKAFTADAAVRFGIKENDNTYLILKFALDDALKQKNYPVEKCITGFFERSFLPFIKGKRQKQKKVCGGANWYYVINLPDVLCDGDTMPLIGKNSNTK